MGDKVYTKEEEDLEIQSLRRIINAYLNYPDAAEKDVRRYERSFKKLPPAHKSFLSHLPLKFQRIRWCISMNTSFIMNMIQAFEPPFDTSEDIEPDHVHNTENTHEHSRSDISPIGEAAQEDGVASAAVNFQQLNLHEEEPHNNAQVENPAVIIPNHLQVSNADCAHLSFGTFSSGAFSGIFQQKALEAHPEVATTVEEPSTVDQPDNRNEKYYNNGTLKPSPTEDASVRMGTRVETLDMPSVSASEPDVLRNEAPDVVHGLQYNMLSVSTHGFPSAAQPGGFEFGYPQGNTQLQSKYRVGE